MIYLDNAATTFPKPQCMISEINRCISEYCGNAGRSGHYMSLKASEKIYECRETLANFFGTSKPENVVFTLNTTYALNIAIKSYFTHGMHVFISNMEHNSVLRPISALKRDGKIEYSIFNIMQPEKKIIEELEINKRPETGMLIMPHASNICGKTFPIKRIGEFCKKYNIIFIVDAAQSAGTNEIQIDNWNIDALCAPAHKGLYGPQGLGFVIFGQKPPKRTLIEGGNGTNSIYLDMGDQLPEMLESGTIPAPLIAGLDASVKWLKRIGISTVKQHETELATKLTEILFSIPGSIIYGPFTPETGIVLYDNQNTSLNQIAEKLNKKLICTRSGYHCAPLAHNTLNTGEFGALRFSFSYFNNKREIDDVYKTLKNDI